jgi:hypothetical protein
VDSEFTAILTAAATEAESHVGEQFIGPDGKTYIGTFKAADAFDLAAAGLQMESNGFPDKTIMALTCSKTQFTVPPYSWRRSSTKLVRQSSPIQKFTVASVTADDPLFFGFVLTHNQPAA